MVGLTRGVGGSAAFFTFKQYCTVSLFQFQMEILLVYPSDGYLSAPNRRMPFS